MPSYASIAKSAFDFNLKRSKLRPCEDEDDVDCFWDARTRGNGEGSSYAVTTEKDGSVVIEYEDGRREVEEAPAPDDQVPSM